MLRASLCCLVVGTAAATVRAQQPTLRYVLRGAEFRTLLGRIRLGDTLRVEVRRRAGTVHVVVVVAGYDRPSVTLTELPGATPLPRAIRDAWRAGAR